MKKLILYFLFLLVFLVPATTHGGLELKFSSPFTVDSFACRTQSWDRTWHEVNNPAGTAIHIYKMQLGMGMDMNGYGDVWTFVGKSSDGSIIAGYNWERYGLPGGLHEYNVDFGQNFIRLAANEGLLINYGCMGLTAAKTKNGYIRVWLWYTVE